jgi:hypothetical protein
MSAHADDLRYFYAETIGDTIEVTAGTGVSTPLSDEALSPGRYMLRCLDYDGATELWVRQGPHGEVEAAASAPSMKFNGNTDPHDLNRELLFFMVRGGEDAANQLAFFSVGGDAVIQVTKVSRDKL